MTAIDLFEAAGCASCRRALAVLAETGRAIRRRDLFGEPLSWDEIKHLAGIAGGVRHLLSTQAPAYRTLDLRRAGVSEAELLSLMAADPSLLRRPIVAVDGIVLVSFEGAAADPAFPLGRGR